MGGESAAGSVGADTRSRAMERGGGMQSRLSRRMGGPRVSAAAAPTRRPRMARAPASRAPRRRSLARHALASC
jgi:hypothetical protein